VQRLLSSPNILVLICLLLLLIPAGRLVADETPLASLEVSVSVKLKGTPLDSAKLQTVHGVAQWFGKGAVDPVPFSITPSQPAKLKLPPGRWVLQAEAPGYWSKGYQLELKDQGALVPLELWPAGTIEGGFTLQDGVAAPAELVASFRPVPETPASQAPPRSQVLCPVEKERQTWRCTVPAGSLDLRMQAPGFIPRYLWGAKIEAGGTFRPGRLDLRRGSAVLGWIVTADGTPLGNGAEVSLRPRGGEGVRGEGQQQRLEELTFKTPVNSRGFFQVDGVPPGAYILEARHERFAPATTSVRVVPGEVTEIANPPLTLELPKVVEVYVDPATAPSGQPWTAKLQKLDRDSSTVTPVAEGTFSLDGSWRKPGIPPGRYLLRVGMKSGETWWLDQIELTENSAPIQVRLDFVDVKGSLHLGKKPLSAKLWFGGKFGAVRMEAEADEKGAFKALLPRSGDWVVQVESEDPPVEREIPKVKIEPKPGTRRAELDLKLPDTTLRGRVTDEKGGPIGKAIVTALSYGAVREDEVQVRTDDAGHFELRGLLPGTTLVQADAGEDRFAHPVIVDIPESQDSPSIVLIARPQLRLSGTVVSSAGPVTGARIIAVPAGMPYISARTVTSDIQGHFEVVLPPKAQEMFLTVSAPGFAFRMLRLPIPENRQFTVGVDQTVGTLVIEREDALDFLDPNAPMIYLLRNGSSEALSHLLGWALIAGAGQQQDAKRSVIPAVEPGEYQACWVLPAEYDGLSFGVTPQGRCVSGFLTPNGELSLKLPAMRSVDRGVSTAEKQPGRSGTTTP
jgi:hypothetical protein